MKEVGNAAKETDLTFKYKAKDPKKKIEKDSLPFQVIITGIRNFRIDQDFLIEHWHMIYIMSVVFAEIYV